MGAATDTRTFEANDRWDAEDKAKEIMRSDLAENGYSYSGTIGMCIDDGFNFFDFVAADEHDAFKFAFGTAANYFDDAHVEKYGPVALLQLKNGKWFIAGMCSC